MRVAFWELAPYLPDATADNLTIAARDAYVRANAGKAFEFMVDVVEEDRAKAGMPPIEEIGASSEDPAVLAHVNAARESGLPPRGHPRAREGHSHPAEGRDRGCALHARRALPRRPRPSLARAELKVPFSASPPPAGKPRVPVSVVACGFTDYFPPEAIHSGESDFTRPGSSPTRACTCSPRSPPARSQIGASPWRTARRASDRRRMRRSVSS